MSSSSSTSILSVNTVPTESETLSGSDGDGCNHGNWHAYTGGYAEAVATGDSLEALLGEAEAERRLERYLEALASPDVEVVSVKISTIYSQISPLAREHTVRVLRERMERLYAAASSASFRRADGSEAPKFVYMDMEEYRDMSITAEVLDLRQRYEAGSLVLSQLADAEANRDDVQNLGTLVSIDGDHVER